MTHFRHCESFSELFHGPPTRDLIMTPADTYNACGYCFDLLQCEDILRQCIKMGYNLVMY